MTRAVFPGSFDPFHNGHLEILERASRIFTQVTVAVMANPQKNAPLFSSEERKQMIVECVTEFQNVDVVAMTGLVVDLVREIDAEVIVRGLRAVSDFENELQMSQMNHQLSGVETLFVPTGSTQSFLSSRLICEVGSFGGDVSALVPESSGAPDEGAIRMSEVFDEETVRRPAHSDGSFDFSAVLDELFEIVDRAKSVPLSSSVMIAKEEVTELLQAARELLPTELQRARRILVDQEEIRGRAERESAALVDEARAQSAHLVQRTEVVRQARHEADRLIAEAEADARRIRHDGDDYVDRKLASFEIVLDRTIRTVKAGRERLTAITPEEPESSPEQNGSTPDDEGVFDQDI